MATLCLLPNAIVRLSIPVASGFFATSASFAWTLLVGVVIVIDTLRNRRLHPVFARGAAVAIVALYLVWMASETPVWDQLWRRALA